MLLFITCTYNVIVTITVVVIIIYYILLLYDMCVKCVVVTVGRRVTEQETQDIQQCRANVTSDPRTQISV